MKGGETQESPAVKRRRDGQAKQDAFDHEVNLQLNRTETPVYAKKMTNDEFAKFIEDVQTK